MAEPKRKKVKKHVVDAVAHIQSKRDEIMSLYRDSAELEPRLKKRTVGFIEDFFRILLFLIEVEEWFRIARSWFNLTCIENGALLFIIHTSCLQIGAELHEVHPLA